MSNTDIIIHGNKDNVAAVIIVGIEPKWTKYDVTFGSTVKSAPENNNPVNQECQMNPIFHGISLKCFGNFFKIFP